MMDLIMSEGFRTILHVAGRLLFSLLFIMNGASHLMRLNPMSAVAASRGVPAPRASVAATGVAILVSGLLVLLGWHRFIASGLLFLFLLATAFFVHPFWKQTEPPARMNEMGHFMKDLALAGAALLIAFYSAPSWPLSLGG